MRPLASLALLCLVACGAEAAEQGPTRARVLDASGDTLLEVAIEVAQTEEARREGLRSYPPLTAQQGLLLLFPIETTVCITNTGVPYPIDLLYASATRQVIAIETIPANAAGPYCHPQTAMALELQGDTLHPTNPAELQLF